MPRTHQPLPGEPILIKENPATYLLADAERALGAAREARVQAHVEAEASFSRSAVILYFAALEGFINFVYAQSEVDDDEYLEWSTERKWRRSAEQCLPRHGTLRGQNKEVLQRPGDPIDPFDGDAGLLAQFIELRDVRNGMVHLQPVVTLVEQDQVDQHFANAAYYPATGLPKKLAHFRCAHAETAAAIFSAMVDRLDVCLKGNIRWLVGAEALYEYRVEDLEWDSPRPPLRDPR